MAGIYGISKKGRYVEEWLEAFNFSGTLTDADVGKAVTWDTTAEKTVKLATTGSEIVGRLETVENRTQEGIKVCTVALKLFGWLPTDGVAVAVGDSVQGGATAGTVKTLAAAVSNRDLRVQHIDSTNNRVYVIKQ